MSIDVADRARRRRRRRFGEGDLGQGDRVAAFRFDPGGGGDRVAQRHRFAAGDRLVEHQRDRLAVDPARRHLGVLDGLVDPELGFFGRPFVFRVAAAGGARRRVAGDVARPLPRRRRPRLVRCRPPSATLFRCCGRAAFPLSRIRACFRSCGRRRRRPGPGPGPFPARPSAAAARRAAPRARARSAARPSASRRRRPRPRLRRRARAGRRCRR